MHTDDLKPGSAEELLATLASAVPRGLKPFGQQYQGVLTLIDDPDAGNVSQPKSFSNLVKWQNPVPLPCDLQLEVVQVAAADDSFPPSNFRNYTAGSYYTGGGSTGSDPKGVVKVEFGGLQPRTVYADLSNGRFSIGGQTDVTVSVCRWGVRVGGVTTQLRVRGQLAPSAGDAELLRYSTRLTVAAADSETITVPPGARYFDAFPDCTDAGTANAPVITISGAVSGKRDTLNGVYYPPSSPLPIQGVTGGGGQTVTVANGGAASVDVVCVFWLQ